MRIPPHPLGREWVQSEWASSLLPRAQHCSHPVPMGSAGMKASPRLRGCSCVSALCLPQQVEQASGQDAGRYTCQAPGHPDRHRNLHVWGEGR